MPVAYTKKLGKPLDHQELNDEPRPQ
jgi:hypothetical protein